MLGWVVALTVAWCVLAVVVAIVLGRVIRLRDRQVPRADRPVSGIPGQRASVDPAAERDREWG